GFATASAQLTIRNPFVAARGSYDTTFTSDAGFAGLVGYLRVSLASSGAFSGSVVVNGRSSALRGVFAIDGSASVTIVRGDGSRVVVALQLAGDPPALAGTVSLGNASVAFDAPRAVFTNTRRAPQAGTYTVLLPQPSQRTFPPSSGWATMTITALG